MRVFSAVQFDGMEGENVGLLLLYSCSAAAQIFVGFTSC